MATEQFTLDEFKNALADYQPEYRGLIYKEHSFLIKLDQLFFLSIRSSIGESGVADSTGQDSIRIIPVSPDGKALGSQAMITRVKGWDIRLKDRIEWFKRMRTQYGNCRVCKQPLPILQVSKDGATKGKWFTMCKGHTPFTLLNDKPATPPPPKPNPEIVKIELRDMQVALDNGIDLSKLNPFQRAIVDSLGRGQIVVEAAPGSGKTKTIEYLIANMILNGIDPASIVCLTFSAKSALEMRTRIAKTLWPNISQEELDVLNRIKSTGEDDQDVNREWIEKSPARVMLADWCCTIHAFCFRLLKMSGYKYKVIANRLASEASGLIKDSMTELDWDDSPKLVQNLIGRAILEDISQYQAGSWFYSLMQAQDGPIDKSSEFGEIYKRYLAFCKRNNAVDFNMMIVMVYKMLKSNPVFLRMCRDKFKYIICDEGQDTDSLQFQIFSMIAEDSKNIVMVGDVDQTLYSWRGAVPEVMRTIFEKRWNTVHRMSLPINYRSTKFIVNTAAKLIGYNYLGEDVARFLKQFQAKETATDGEKAGIIKSKTVEGIAAQAASHILNSEQPGKWWILSRTRAECAAIHTELIKNKIPAINLNGGLIFGSPHIRKVIAYAQLACNHNNSRDDIEILSEVANVATRNFIAPLTRRRHLEGCQNEKPWVNCGCPVILEEGNDYSYTRYYGRKSVEQAGGWDGIMQQMGEKNRGGYPTLQSKGATDLVQFVEQIELLKDNARMAVTAIVEECVLPWLEHEEGVDDSDPDNGKQEEFNVILEMIHDGQTLEEFLKEVDEISANNKEGGEDDSVLVSTVHKAKGCERDKVIVNLTRCPIIPPKSKPGKLPSGKPPTIEEERCIAFVGVTRAREQYWVAYAETWNGQEMSISPFISELGITEDQDDN